MGLVAHQGGWDEVLLIGVPIVIIIGLLWLAKRRVDAASRDSSPDSVPDVSAAFDERADG